MIPLDNSDVTNDDIFKMLAGELMPSDIHKRRERAEQERLQSAVQEELKEFYGALSTSHLLHEYRQMRRGGYVVLDIESDSYYSCYDLSSRNFPLERLRVKHGVFKEFQSAYGVKPFRGTAIDALKELLDGREHLPRGKASRQQRAKQRKGQGKSKNR